MNRDRIQSIVCVTIVMAIAAILAIPGTVFLAAEGMRMPAHTSYVVSSLASVPDDGVPRMFVIFAKDRDSWTIHRERAVGHVFVIRQPGSADVRAFKAISRRGMSICYDHASNRFEQSCWNVHFSLDGKPLPGSDTGIDDMIAVHLTIRQANIGILASDWLGR